MLTDGQYNRYWSRCGDPGSAHGGRARDRDARGRAAGQSRRGRRAEAAQILFGSTWGSTLEFANGELNGEAKARAERRSKHFTDLFNLATLPFYWGRFEPVRGKPDTQRVLKAAQWYKDHGCVTKGHPLCWHTVTADWLLELSDEEILQAQIDRIKRDVGDFAGVIDMWDVVNEAVIMPVFDKYDNGITRICKMMGRIELLRTMFETARSNQPQSDPADQRLRHVRRLRHLDRGLPRGGDQDRRDRHSVAHASRLLGRRENRAHPVALRALRAADPLHRDDDSSPAI